MNINWIFPRSNNIYKLAQPSLIYGQLSTRIHTSKIPVIKGEKIKCIHFSYFTSLVPLQISLFNFSQGENMHTAPSPASHI